MKEKTVAMKFVKAALRANYLISLADDEDTLLYMTDDVAKINTLVDCTDYMVIRVMHKGGHCVGAAIAVYGNNADGSELFADWSDTPEINALLITSGYTAHAGI